MVDKRIILKKADKLKSDYGSFSSDPFALLKQSDITLIECDLGNKTLGQTIKHCKCHAILLNEKLVGQMKVFVLWHEIAHVLLHSGLSTANFRKNSLNGLIMGIEAEASMFAIEMMRRTIDSIELKRMSNYEVIEYLGLPHEFDHLVI